MGQFDFAGHQPNSFTAGMARWGWEDREMGTCGVTRGGDLMVWTILALACIVLAFVGEIIDERILLGTLEWFVAAIAFNTLGALPFVKKR